MFFLLSTSTYITLTHQQANNTLIRHLTGEFHDRNTADSDDTTRRCKYPFPGTTKHPNFHSENRANTHNNNLRN